MRYVVGIILLLLSLQATGVAAALGDGPCHDDGDCPGDASGGQCPPNCHSCTCCSLPAAASPATIAGLQTPDSTDACWIGTFQRLALREPADILHVPILVLA